MAYCRFSSERLGVALNVPFSVSYVVAFSTPEVISKL